jgi:hypothetical protein
MSKNVQLKHNVSEVRCFAPTGLEIQRYGAHSQVFPDRARRWDTLICVLGLPQGGVCAAVAYQTGQQAGSIRLGTFHYKGCTPYQLNRRSTASTYN